ncbi:hypothetical protein [Haloarcula salinisoli]|uniref:DUF8156 domain-containing protein n=1 Tax=Haloarcula salinisoli TaxID=2487746 RepID=A0A8J7YJT7_9EURY|nr:hypothetical protein [Halomicroarcula salinisoli]MBX0285984.1 hypothetical protein [Halomicroarcula salinisoli]MBX0302528.1 hypothetical protein [Halomicroarcula salinisoli]
MGRTNPTYRGFLDGYEGEFDDYRRALRRRHQADFDRLFDGARAFADAAGYANHLDRDTLVLVSMLLAHEERLREQSDEIARLRAAVEAGDEAPDSVADERRTDGAQ